MLLVISDRGCTENADACSVAGCFAGDAAAVCAVSCGGRPGAGIHAPNVHAVRFPLEAGRGHRLAEVSLPHYGAPLGNASTQYETEFTLREIPTDRRVFVVVNGADYKAHIFINNHLVGSHEGFFATFEFDITKWAHPGCNTLTIELENDYVMLGNRTERSEAVLCGDKIYAATGPGYDDPQLAGTIARQDGAAGHGSD